MKRLKHLDFLIDILVLACTSFGGPQVHFALFLDRLVKKRAYLTEEELFEIQALCSVLPGPTSTQMITAIGLKRGGTSLAYFTLLCWILPAVLIMTAAAFGMTFLRNPSILHYVLPVGIGLILQAGWFMAKKVITGPTYVIILLVSLFLGIAFHSPYIFPLVLLLGGIVSSFNYQDFPRQTKHRFIIPWANFHLYWVFLVFLALLGHFTDYFPIRLFENFYRNGSLVFGGGHILAPVLYTEFVEFKQLINSDVFLTGMALSQTLPGPVFALTSYLGVLLMKDYGVVGEIAGSVIGALGIFLPGTFLIFFVFRIWSQLKQYRFIRASLAGIQAASVGLTLVAVFTFTRPMVEGAQVVSLGIVAAAFILAEKTKIPAILLFTLALIAGIMGF